MDFRDKYCTTQEQIELHNRIIENIKKSKNKSIFHTTKGFVYLSDKKSLILALSNIYELPEEVVEPVVNKSFRKARKKKKRFKKVYC